jgi:DNA-directed RNA polymerase subunit RPC12/RpoP
MNVRQFKKSLKSIHGDSITYVRENLGHYIVARCKFHGEYTVRKDSLLAGYKCSKCDGERKRSQYKLSDEEIQRRLDEKHEGNIVLTGQYANQRTNVEFYCKKHMEHWFSLVDTVIRGSGCPKCSMKAMQTNRSFSKKRIILNGKRQSVMGYEPYAIEYLKDLGYKESEICVSTNLIPIIKYANGRKHFPDIYIKKDNILVEVKSPYTMLRNEETFKNLVDKRLAAIECGYKYKVLMFNELGNHIKLPKAWWLLDFQAINAKVSNRCRTFN